MKGEKKRDDFDHDCIAKDFFTSKYVFLKRFLHDL